MKLSRKQFATLVSSRIHNEFYALASFSARFLERIFRNSKTTGLLGLEFLNCFKNDPSTLHSCRQFNIQFNAMCEKPSLSSSQTHMKEYGNSPEYLLRGKRKTFVNVFPPPKLDEILTGATCRGKKRGREQGQNQEQRQMGVGVGLGCVTGGFPGTAGIA